MSDDAINTLNKGKPVFVRPTFFWKFMAWWIRTFRGSSNNLQVGTNYYGGVIHLYLFLESPGLREAVANATFNLEQAKHFHAEMGRQIERMEAFS